MAPGRLRFRNEDPNEHMQPNYMVEAIKRMRGILQSAGYSVDDWDIEQAWQAYSESMCAGWLVLYPEDATNLQIIMDYLEPDPGVRA